MSIELKIKAKHLALEPAIIRKEEDILKRQIKYLRTKEPETAAILQFKLEYMIKHRRWNVTNEARATHLARAYLAGKSYCLSEKRSKENDVMFKLYIVPRILAMVTKYGTKEQRKADRSTIIEWSKI